MGVLPSRISLNRTNCPGRPRSGARLGSAGLGKAGHGTDKARRTGAVGAAVFLATHGYARPARHGLAWQGEASKDRVEIEWIGRKVLRLA